jgi:diguanylate cyclase (GGDEF)-like protein
VGLPIIYVSSETDTNRQTSAMAAGAEGFLTKPVQPSKLVSEVALRAERMRTMRAQMVRDSLTGLLNHNTILHHLEVGLNRARRRDEPLALAMLDVDHFKQVNDRFGHPAGDQVLIALSRELRRRLRASDAVGRYGGEEFAIVLEETDLSTAAEVVNELRRDFARVLFSAGDQTFNCTFSAGVAGFPRRRSSDALVEAADAALYRAKHLGRNRVEIDGAGSSDDAGTVDR